MFLTRYVFFGVKFLFQKNVLVIVFSIFCFVISALDLFYLINLLECYLIVLAESGGCRTILLLQYLIFISKNKKIFDYHSALHLAFCIVLALDLLWSISQDFIQESLHLSFEEYCAFHVVAYRVFHGHNAFALIVRCAFYFMLCHNIVSCMTIYLF